MQRLGLDHVDLYQIHGFDPVTPIEETVRALDDVVRSGKARYVGFSNLPAWLAIEGDHVRRAQRPRALPERAGLLLDRRPRHRARDRAAVRRPKGVAILPWSPLAGGLLSGKFDPDKQGPKARAARRSTFRRSIAERLPRVLAALRKVAEATDVSVARVALAWQLTRPFVTSIIIGAKTSEQLADNLAAVDVKLSPEHVKLLDEASALPPRVSGLDGRVAEQGAAGHAAGEQVTLQSIYGSASSVHPAPSS